MMVAYNRMHGLWFYFFRLSGDKQEIKSMIKKNKIKFVEKKHIKKRDGNFRISLRPSKSLT